MGGSSQHVVNVAIFLCIANKTPSCSLVAALKDFEDLQPRSLCHLIPDFVTPRVDAILQPLLHAPNELCEVCFV